MGDGGEIVKVESLVQEFLEAQSLKVLPQGPFGDAVNQFVVKDDKHAMELFVSEHLSGQVKQMLGLESDDEDLNSAMEIYRTRIEQQDATSIGNLQAGKRRVLKPKPDTWDSDFEGNWEDEPDAWAHENISQPVSAPTTQGRSSRGKVQQPEVTHMDTDDSEPVAAKPTRRAAAKPTKAATKVPAPKKTGTRGTRSGAPAAPESEEEDMGNDVIMESDDEPPLPPPTKRRQIPKSAAPAKKPAATRKPAARNTKKASGATGTQTQLDFSQAKGKASKERVEISDDEISDGDDAFEPAPPARSTRSKK